MINAYSKCDDHTLWGTIPGELPNKSNSRMIVNGISIKSQKARDWTRKACLILSGAKRLRTYPKEVKLALAVWVYQKDMRRDLDIELLCDALQHAGVIENDRQLWQKYARRFIDKEKPRAEWTIRESNS